MLSANLKRGAKAPYRYSTAHQIFNESGENILIFCHADCHKVAAWVVVHKTPALAKERLVLAEPAAERFPHTPPRY